MRWREWQLQLWRKDENQPMMNDDRCPECGAAVSGGQAACQALLEEVAARAYADLRYAAYYNLAFDAYCMQHIEPYCHSAKSYAAHLTRLCCGLEYAGDPKIYAAIQRWLNGQVDLEKPTVLSFRGHITVVEVHAAREMEEYIRLVQAWARDVWDAYASQHEFARQWLQEALG